MKLLRVPSMPAALSIDYLAVIAVVAVMFAPPPISPWLWPLKALLRLTLDAAWLPPSFLGLDEYRVFVSIGMKLDLEASPVICFIEL